MTRLPSQTAGDNRQQIDEALALAMGVHNHARKKASRRTFLKGAITGMGVLYAYNFFKKPLPPQEIEESSSRSLSNKIIRYETNAVKRLSENINVWPEEYRVYFDNNSANITKSAAAVLDRIIAIAEKEHVANGISISGYTDHSGTSNYNQRLAIERATNVSSYLAQNGLDYHKITAVNGYGEDNFVSRLSGNSSDAQQRVVVIRTNQSK